VDEGGFLLLELAVDLPNAEVLPAMRLLFSKNTGASSKTPKVPSLNDRLIALRSESHSFTFDRRDMHGSVMGR
jgi:hypothetical protein